MNIKTFSLLASAHQDLEATWNHYLHHILVVVAFTSVTKAGTDANYRTSSSGVGCVYESGPGFRHEMWRGFEKPCMHQAPRSLSTLSPGDIYLLHSQVKLQFN